MRRIQIPGTSVWKLSCIARCWNDAGRHPQRMRSIVSGRARNPLNDLQAAPPKTSQHVEDNGTPLEEWIGPQLQLMEQTVDVGAQRLTLVVPRSSDAVMDMYIDAEMWDRDPYWSRAWPSALALGRLLLQNPHLVEGKRVCEIGAGLGIAGIAAALAGASQVVLTDREPLALECALRTAIASGISNRACGWLPSSPNSRVAAALLDWNQKETGLGGFDVVLACDILYERPAVGPVSRLVPKLLNASSAARFILADPAARTRAHRLEFVDVMRSNRRLPLQVETAEMTSVEMDGLSTEIQLAIFSSNATQGTVGVKLF